jgi:hypothetical protein
MTATADANAQAALAGMAITVDASTYRPPSRKGPPSRNMCPRNRKGPHNRSMCPGSRLRSRIVRAGQYGLAASANAQEAQSGLPVSANTPNDSNSNSSNNNSDNNNTDNTYNTRNNAKSMV